MNSQFMQQARPGVKPPKRGSMPRRTPGGFRTAVFAQRIRRHRAIIHFSAAQHALRPHGTMKHQHEALVGFPIVVTIPVLWGDLDAFGHVNNLVYLRWCETARVEYMVRSGMWVPLPPQGIGPILASIRCDYKIPLNYPDTVHIGARVTRIGNSSLQMEHRIVSHERNELAAEADSTVVMIDYSTGRSSPVSTAIRAKIAEIEGVEFAQFAAPR